MELVCLGGLTLLWLRFIARATSSRSSAFIPSVILAFLSWILIVQLIGVVLRSAPLTLAVVVSLMVVGWIWPGRRLVRLRERRPMLR
jgi:hypothetical protein